MPPMISFSPLKTGVALDTLDSALFVQRTRGITSGFAFSQRQIGSIGSHLIALTVNGSNATNRATFHLSDPTAPWPAAVRTGWGLANLGIARVNPNGVIVAALDNDSYEGNSLYYSGDFGTSWVSRPDGVSASIEEIVYGTLEGMGEVWVACSFGAASTGTTRGMVKSLDGGYTWTAVTQPTSGNYTQLGYAGGRFIVFSARTIYTTTNLTSWTSQQHISGTPQSTWMANGKLFVIHSDTAQIAWTENGIDWFTTDTHFVNCRQVVYGNGMYVALSQNGEYQCSHDLINWTAGIFPGTFKGSIVEYWNGHFAFFAGSGSNVYYTYQFPPA